MHKRLKIILPGAQVLAFACVLLLTKRTAGEREFLLYALPARQVIMDLNYPLVALAHIIVSLDRLSGYLGLSWEPKGIMLTAAITTAAVVLFCCIALFWYFAAAEFYKRRHGESLMRFSSRSLELVKVIGLLLFGTGGLYRVYTEAMWPVSRRLSHDGLWPVEIILGDLLLVAWASIFIGMSISDFRRLTLSRRT